MEKNITQKQLKETIQTIDDPSRKTNFLTLLAPLFFFVVVLILVQNENLAKPSKASPRYDAAGYYAYLPGTFIYHNYHFDFHQQFTGYPIDDFVINLGDSIRINKYPMGVALLQAPFFLAAHVFAKARGEGTGYSKPYYLSAKAGTAFYSAFGLLLIGLILLPYFPDHVIGLTQISLGFGTNLFYYTAYENLMSHAYSFFLFAGCLWVGLKWREHYRRKYLLSFAILAGLIAATRLTNIIFLIVPLFWGFRNFEDLRTLHKRLFAEKWVIFFSIILFLLPILPQLIYLKILSGHWIFNTYQGEQFFWNSPQWVKVLVSYRKGWLVWSPLIVLGFIGMVWWRKHISFWPVMVYLVINLYIVSSWWCWWYGGGFGMRALIEASVPMSVGIAFSIHSICKNRVGSYIFAVVFPWLLALNFLQTHQYSKGIIHWDAMSKKSYWEVFGIVNPPSDKVMQKRNQYLKLTDGTAARTDELYRANLD